MNKLSEMSQEQQQTTINLVHLSQRDPVIVKHFETLGRIKTLVLVLTLMLTTISVIFGVVAYRGYTQFDRVGEILNRVDHLVTKTQSIESGIESMKEMPIVGKMQDLYSKLKGDKQQQPPPPKEHVEA
jgi:L-cystine uptake protein TcyP (sodium:dicarboxylate symporter family)